MYVLVLESHRNKGACGGVVSGSSGGGKGCVEVSPYIYYKGSDVEMGVGWPVA